MKIESTAAKQFSLEEVKTEFETWRKNKPNKIAVIPDALWKKAVKLTELYKVGEIVSTLRLSGGQFNTKLKHFRANCNKKQLVKSSSKPTITTENPDFFELPNNKILNNVSGAKNGSKIEISYSNGHKLCMECISNENVRDVIRYFFIGVND